MFVFHCKIDFTEKLKFPKKEKKYLKNKKKKSKILNENTGTEEAHSSKDDKKNFSDKKDDLILNVVSGNANSIIDNKEEFFYSVSCDVCNTKVAVYDKDEVYHFFNIVTSY